MKVDERLEKIFQRKAEAKTQADQRSEGYKHRGQVFIEGVVAPAARSLADSFKKFGREVKVTESMGREGAAAAHVVISHGSQTELDCTISSRGGRPTIEFIFTDRKNGRRYSAESTLRTGIQDYEVESITKDEIVDILITNYDRDNPQLLE